MSRAPDLKPCPFCGGEAYIREYAFGHSSSGGFTASYEVGCSKCNIAFKKSSKFTLENGQPVFSVNGYEDCVEIWNRRANDETR